jgi:hypothetical protein
LIAGVIGVLFITILGVSIYWLYDAPGATESLAVMPFVNESGTQTSYIFQTA